MRAPSPGLPGRLFLAVLALVVSGAALAQAAGLSPKFPPKEFVDPDERISGSAVVGVAYVGDKDTVDPARLYAFIDSPPTGDLTLEFNGIDGRYRLVATYDRTAVTGAGSGVVPLNLGDLKYRQRLLNYNISEGAALLSDDDGRHFPVRWGTGARAGAIRVYLNAERADAYFLVQKGGEREKVMCTAPGSLTPPFKFNRVCDVPAAQFSGGKVEIQRRVGGRRLDPVTVEIPARPAN